MSFPPPPMPDEVPMPAAVDFVKEGPRLNGSRPDLCLAGWIPRYRVTRAERAGYSRSVHDFANFELARFAFLRAEDSGCSPTFSLLFNLPPDYLERKMI